MRVITYRTAFILIILFAFYGWKLSPLESAINVASAFIAKMKSHKSMSYHVKLRAKYFNNDDTSKMEANCKLIRSDNDSAFNGYVYLNGYQIGRTNKKYPFEQYYDLNKIYSVDDSLETITVYNNPKSQRGAITSTAHGGVIQTYFLDIYRLEDDITDTTVKFSIANDNDYWKIGIVYESDKQFSNMWVNLWISTYDTTLRRISTHCTFQGNDQYMQWDVDSISYDKETPQELKAIMKNKISTYKIKQYVPPTTESEKTLNNGVRAPVFSGIDFATGKKVSLSDYKGKLVLLDFWYMNCPWCIREMPGIEKINNEFSSKGLVVLGINSFDTTATAKTKLPGFIEKNKNTYSTILTSGLTDKAYNVTGYPTLYLINKRGEVAFSKIGYSKNIDSVLEVEIKKIQ